MQQAKWQNVGASHFAKVSSASITVPCNRASITVPCNRERKGKYPCLTDRDAVVLPSLLYMVLYAMTVRQDRPEQGRDGTDMPLSQTPGNP